MRHGTVFFDSLTNEVKAALEEHRGYLQGAVNAQTRLKRTPKLVFMADPAIASGNSVEEALRRVHLEDDER